MPVGRFGSKRPLVSLDGFFDVLQKENVHVITDPITSIDAQGVVTKAPPRTNDAIVQIEQISSDAMAPQAVSSTDILRKADVLILGTGFKNARMGRCGAYYRALWDRAQRSLEGTSDDALR